MRIRLYDRDAAVMMCETCKVELESGDWICAGPSVVAFGFCKKHKEAHDNYCPNLKSGLSVWWKIHGGGKAYVDKPV